MMVLRVAKPIKPGTAQTTKSAGAMTRVTSAGSDKSARMGVMCGVPASRASAASLASTAVTWKSTAKSLMMALPTSPAPKTVMVFMVSSPLF